MRRRFWSIGISVLAILALLLLLSMESCYMADSRALRALKSDSVTVEETDFGWRFDGPAEDTALIFYPGAKVDAAAYAPLLHRLAQDRMDVFLVKMPLHFAVLGIHRADRILERYNYENWYIGGHSLGGVAAVYYAAERDMKGVVLLASYPTRAIEEPMLQIYGTEDGVLNLKKAEAADDFGTVERVLLPGANHSGFGNYGAQAGDRAPRISPEEQQEETAAAIVSWLP